MEKAIKKAIEGGWQPQSHPNVNFKKDVNTIKAFAMVTSNAFLLDPLFWQALGKACEWEQIKFPPQTAWSDKQWLLHAQNFYHINLTEGWDKAIAYLEELLK